MNSKNPTNKKRYGVLFLSGVFTKDCQQMEEIFHDRLVADNVTNEEQIKQYNKIPALFTGWDNWPKQTNLLCWTCSRTFKTVPWFEPQSIEPISVGCVGRVLTNADIKNSNNQKSFSIVPKGNFCCKNCVRYYIDKGPDDLASKHDKVEMLKLVSELYDREPVMDILPCLPPTDMIQYGGPLTQSQWKKRVSKLDKNYNNEVKSHNLSNTCNAYIDRLYSSSSAL